jgi:tetratricopeptide (TPR) repeat protein
LFGAAWPSFSAQLNSLIINPRDEDGFHRMFRMAQTYDAESKVPQILRKLLAEKQRDNPRLKTLIGLFYKEIRDYGQAITYFRDALKTSPDDYYAHYQLAHLLGKQEGDASFKEALEHYRTAAARVGASDVEHKSRIFQEWGELVMDRSGAAGTEAGATRAQAAQIWDRLIADERRFDKPTYERLAQIYQRYEMWEKAAATYQACLANVIGEDNPARVATLDSIGQLAEKTGNNKAAIDAYREALALVDENHWLHKRLVAQILKYRKKLGEQDAYLRELEQFAKDRPQSVEPLRDLALAHASSDAVPAAAADLEKAHALSPKDTSIISELLLLYGRSADPASRAKKPALYRKLIAAMPENFDAYVALADSYWDLSDAAQTQEALQMLQENASRLPEKDLVLARAYRKYGMPAKARNAFERAVAADPGNSGALMELCDFALQCAEGKKTDPDLQRAVEIRDALMASGRLDESGFVRLMQVFESHQRPEEAKSIIGYAAVEAFPQSFLCRSALADLHYSRKEFHKAIQHYVLALAMAPNFYFKRLVNDRLVTLTFNYGRRVKNFMAEPTEDEKAKGLLGGPKGEGLAPWVYYLRLRIAANPQDGDSMMLLAQINDTVQVDAKLDGQDVKTDLAASLALYQSVVDMDLKNLDAHAALARSHATADNIKEAVQENWVLEELSPVGKWQYIMNAGDIFALAGEKEKALKNWERVQEQATTEPNLVHQLAVRMYQAGKLDAAVELARKAVAANKNQFRFHVTLANLLDEVARTDAAKYPDAVTEYKVAVEMASQNPGLVHFLSPVLKRLMDVQIALGRSYWAAKRFDAALQCYSDALATVTQSSRIARPERGAIQEDGVTADLNMQRARCMLALGQKTAGEELLRATASAQPAAAYWWDSLQTIRGRYLLALYAAGKSSGEAALPVLPAGHLSVSAKKVLHLPALISAMQMGSGETLWLDTGTQFYRVDLNQAAVNSVSVPELTEGSVRYWLDANQIGLVDDGSFKACDLASSKCLWKSEALVPQSIAAGARVLAIFCDADPKRPARNAPLKVLDRATGKELWQCETATGEMTLSDELLAVRSASEVTGFDVESGKLLWRAPLDRKALYRRPIIAGDALLLVNDLSNEVTAYDLRSGEMRYTRRLRDALVCDPVVPASVPAGRDTGPTAERVVFHTLRKRALTLQCLDTVTGRPVWEASLVQPTEATSKQGTPMRMEGLSLPPLVWQGYLLHLDLAHHCIWPVRIENGAVGEPLDLTKALESRFLDELSSWDVSGTTLCLMAKTGRVVLVKLVSGER